MGWPIRRYRGITRERRVCANKYDALVYIHRFRHHWWSCIWHAVWHGGARPRWVRVNVARYADHVRSRCWDAQSKGRSELNAWFASCTATFRAVSSWSIFWKGLSSVQHLHGMAVAAVTKRLDASEKSSRIVGERSDILEMLLQSKDTDGHPMDREELISEALTQLIAGSDTVSNTACACIYWILDGERRNPGSVIPQLQAELDGAIPQNDSIASHKDVINLPFLRQCINEAMRLHSTSAIGLPRIVTASHGVGLDENHFPQGTVLSVPSFTIHHDADIWGEDVEVFRPERWANLSPRQKVCFNPFSYGPRACVGQNVALMEFGIDCGDHFQEVSDRALSG